MSETRQQFRSRRARELHRTSKSQLIAMYYELGFLGSATPISKWRKDEIISGITELEWRRLPEDQRAVAPTLMSTPCETCGKGYEAPAHREGGSHNATFVHDGKPDVPHYEPCGRPLCGMTYEEHEAYEGLALCDHYYEFPAEEQATPAEEEQSVPQPAAQPDATPQLDVSKPYCYQIDRTDTDTPRMLSWGGMSTAPVDGMSTETAACYEAAQSRILHRYYGPLTVRMWPKRDNEHYRMEPPQGCYRLDVQDQTGTTPEALRQQIDTLHTVEGIAWPAVPITPEVKR